MISPAILHLAGKSLKKTKLPSILLLFSILPSSPFSTSCKTHHYLHQTPPPPVPKKVPFKASAHGVTWQDPYHWMKHTDDPDLINYLDQENSYADAFMDDTKSLQQTFYSEMIARLPSKISTPPERWGPWFYFQYIPEGKEYPVLCRKLAAEKNGWIQTIYNYVMGEWRKVQILLDWNEIAEQYGYVHVGTCRVSPDHNYLAFTLDITGAERFMLQAKNLSNGVLENLRVDDVVSLAWAPDGCTLFYTVSDESQRPHRVQYCKIGQDPINNIEMYTEKDSRFCVDITSTKDGKFITVNSNSRTSSEVYVVDATNPQSGLHRVNIRIPGVQYFLEHHHGFFYALTNQLPCGNNLLSTGNYYLIRCQVQDLQTAKWETIILPSEDISIHDMDIFNGHLVLFLNKNGSPVICSIKLPIDESFKKEMKIDDLNPWYFPLPSNLCEIVPGSNHDFNSSQYRAIVSSPVIPDVIVDYDMSRYTFSIVHQDEVPGSTPNFNSNSSSLTCKRESFDFQNTQSERGEDVINDEGQKWSNFSDAYCCELKEVVSHDGIKIPLTILYSRRAHHKGQSPGLLQGYGAYGQVLDKSWSSDRLSLLDRGWVVAFADVRGGAGADPSWHKSGSGLFKSNSIADFVACAEYLISEHYVHKYHLGAFGGSAGGLLVGAAANRYPQLFRAIILKVPFLDICNTLLDPSLPLTMLDYEEFGNPQIQSQFQSILSYSPYDNVPSGVCCPAMLVTASFNDSRVGVWEPAKWVAKVRENACSDCSQAVILKTNMKGGHFGEGGLYSQCEESAYEYAFLLFATFNQ
nr:PREDICTED: protease 2 isoform X2 [Daucus carota subsp. sativus]